MAVNLLLGMQWGDEGKGKIVDVLTKEYDIIARFQGGPNAGHTLIFEGNKHVLHTIPSGIFHKNIINVIGNGVVIDPIILKNEIKALEKYNLDLKSTLFISRKAHLILPTHRLLDAASEAIKGKSKIGSTLKGIGPTYMDKTGRNGIRIGDLESRNWKDKYKALTQKHLGILQNLNAETPSLKELENDFFDAIEFIKRFKTIDSEVYLNKAILDGKKILAEGAQGALLDIDFGTYPFVTSSNTTASGACTGLGIPPTQLKEVFGIFKAYTTRVGEGPFPTELFDEQGSQLAKVGNEFGATTGRARRCGWLDLVALKYAVIINGATQLMMMKGDVLSGFDEIKVATSYIYNGEEIDYMPYAISKEDLTPKYTTLKGWEQDLTEIDSEKDFPKELGDYIQFIENYLNIPIKIVSVGPDRKQTVFRN